MDVKANEVIVYIPKKTSDAPWPRLTKSTDKLAYLGVDWDQFEQDSDTEEEKAKERDAPKKMGSRTTIDTRFGRSFLADSFRYVVEKLLQKQVQKLDAKDAKSSIPPYVYLIFVAIFVVLIIIALFFALQSRTSELFSPDL